MPSTSKKKVTVKKPAAGKKPAPAKKAAAPSKLKAVAKKAAAPSKLKAVAKKTVAAVKKLAVKKKPAPAPVAKKAVPAPAPKPVAKPVAKVAVKPAVKPKAKKVEPPRAPKVFAPSHKAPQKSESHRPPYGKKVEALSKPEATSATAIVKKPEPAKVIHIDFTTGDYVVYPTHGVGRIDAIETQSIAGMELKLIVIRFDKEKMTLRVPIEKAKASGLRKLSSRQQMDVALTTLKGRSRTSRAMWSRRAQEYEAKINSGDPVSIAEVLRDLHRNAGQPDQSYSERQIYEAALDRLARELAAVEKTDREAAMLRLEEMLKAA